MDTLLTASLRNNSPSFIAFKVKTTATDRYRVRPNLGVGEHTLIHGLLHRSVPCIGPYAPRACALCVPLLCSLGRIAGPCVPDSLSNLRSVLVHLRAV